MRRKLGTSFNAIHQKSSILPIGLPQSHFKASLELIPREMVYEIWSQNYLGYPTLKLNASTFSYLEL